MKYNQIILYFLVLTTQQSLFAKYSFKYLGTQNIASDFKYKDILFGGISGMAYLKDDVFLAVSDDRSSKGPSRFYHLQFSRKELKFEVVQQTFLKKKNGENYKKSEIDNEGIALLKNKNILISSEGDNRDNKGIPPAVKEYDINGSFIKDWPVAQEYLHTKKTGVRFNLGLESLTSIVVGDNEFAFTLNEEPLYQDFKTINKDMNERFNRLTKYKNGEIEGVYLVKLSAIPNPNNYKALSGVNGQVELIALSENKLIMMERAFLRNSLENIIRLYEIDITNADKVKRSIISKKQLANIKHTKKELIYDLKEIIPQMHAPFNSLDNMEALTLVRDYFNKDSHLLVISSDNNFSNRQRSLFIFFELKIEN